MSKLIFVESTFQLQLAREIKGVKNIYYSENSTLNKLIKLPRIIYLIIRNENIYIYDHRNSLLIVAMIINVWNAKKIYIVDDGFHSILVDKLGSKYLYRQTNFFKKIIIWFFQSKILKCKRFKQIDANFKKDVVLTNCKYAVFVDQSDFEISLQNKIKDIESKYDFFDFAKHPRNDKYNLFSYSNDSFENLVNSKIKRDFYGVYSTGLLYALKNDHNVFLIKIDSIKSKISGLEIDYIRDIQDILIDLGATYEV